MHNESRNIDLGKKLDCSVEKSKDKLYRGAAKQIGFIVGTGRCGTTILASILNAHSKICVPPELSFLVQCYGKDLLFEKFISGEIYRYSATDFVELIRQSSPYRLDDFIDLEKHFAEMDYPITSLKEIVKSLYDRICFKKSKEVLLEQTTWYGLELHSIRKIFPELKVIHIIRDGRDVAISAHRSGWWNMGVMENLERWAKEINRIRRFGLDYPGNYYELKYENLVNDTENELKKLLSFLNLEYEQEMLLPEQQIPYFDLLKNYDPNCHSLEYHQWRKNPENVLFRGSTYAWKKCKEHNFLNASKEVNKTLFDLGYELNDGGIDDIEKDACTLKIMAQERRRQSEVQSRPCIEEIRDGIDRPLTCHILDPNAPWFREGVVLQNHPGMISDEEKQYYVYIGRFYSGCGEVVELGPWLGCSTVHLLIGLKTNPKFRNKKLHVVDDFIWRSSWMDPYYAEPDRPKNGESFRKLFNKLTHRFKDDMTVYEAKIHPMEDNQHLPQFQWDGGLIEFCFIDCGRNLFVNESWYQTLVKAFIPGKTLIVLQGWQTHKEIPERWWNQLKDFTDSKKEALEIVHEVTQGGIAAFRYKGEKRLVVNVQQEKESASSGMDMGTGKEKERNPWSVYAEIRQLIESGKFQDALSGLQCLVTDYPDFARAWNDLGFLLYAAGDTEKAGEAYEKAVQLAPEDPIFRKNLADFLFIQKGRHEEALEHYQKVLAGNPDDAEALTAMAYINYAQGRIAESLALIRKAMALDPGQVTARALYERIRHGEKKTSAPETPSNPLLATIIVAGDDDPLMLAQAIGTICQNTNPDLVEVRILCNPADDSAELRSAFANARAAGLQVYPVDCTCALSDALHRAASEAKGNYLVLMDAKVILSENWFPQLLEVIEEKSDVGAVSPKIASLLGTLREAGCSFLSEEGVRGRGEGEYIYDPAWNYACDTPNVSRYVTLMNRAAWNECRGYAAGHEDFSLLLLALGASIRNAGFRLRYQPHCVVAVVDYPEDRAPLRPWRRLSGNGLREIERPVLRQPSRSHVIFEGNTRPQVLVAGAFQEDFLEYARDTMQVLSCSSGYRVVQRWLQIGEDRSITLPASVEVEHVPKPPTHLFPLIHQRTLSRISLDAFDYLIVVLADLLLPVGFLDAFLGLQNRFGFAIAQPALSSRSSPTHPFFEQCPGLDAREVRSILGFPLVSFHRKIYPSLSVPGVAPFERPEEIDLWVREIQEQGFPIGVIDAVPVNVISLVSGSLFSGRSTLQAGRPADMRSGSMEGALVTQGWVLEGGIA